MDKWTVDDVARWVAEKGLVNIAENFRDHEIDGMSLMSFAELPVDDLKDMLQDLGVRKVGPRIGRAAPSSVSLSSKRSLRNPPNDTCHLRQVDCR